LQSPFHDIDTFTDQGVVVFVFVQQLEGQSDGQPELGKFPRNKASAPPRMAPLWHEADMSTAVLFLRLVIRVKN
jgi:hypothetical protein